MKWLKDNGYIEQYYSQLDSLNAEKNLYYPSNVHGIDHTSRVILFATTLANLDNLDNRMRYLLLTAARYYDVGRIDDRETKEHGSLGSSKVKNLKLIDERYKSSYLKSLDDKENPLRPINHQCDLIRQFLNAHSGFDRDDLQDYLNLYCFMNKLPTDRLRKVNELLELALTTKVSLKYRAFFNVNKKN